ncbi:MAG: hypothetical protein QM647_06795 [Asticcacaulis sp.]|uniref:hypothetical protein n=1 Tax=Asticcacaulis sp. TaxID=1872648 RepID=UPI0039E66C55
MKLWIVPTALTLVLLGGCNLFTKPETGPAYAIPAPSGKGEIQLYPATDPKAIRPSVEVRSGDCDKDSCETLAGEKWQPLPKTEATALPYLSVMMPTGSAYSPDLWRPVGNAGRHVLVSLAGFDGVQRGLFDGLRIGLQDASFSTYFTAYSVETGAALKARGLCVRDMAVDSGDPLKASCAQKVGDDRYVLPLNGEVVIVGDKAWLLQRRPDRSANLIDLFALPRGTPACLPGLIIDTEGQWMGTADKALSPDLFVSRARPSAEYETHKAHLLKACP